MTYPTPDCLDLVIHLEYIIFNKDFFFLVRKIFLQNLSLDILIKRILIKTKRVTPCRVMGKQRGERSSLAFNIYTFLYLISKKLVYQKPRLKGQFEPRILKDLRIFSVLAHQIFDVSCFFGLALYFSCKDNPPSLLRAENLTFIFSLRKQNGFAVLLVPHRSIEIYDCDVTVLRVHINTTATTSNLVVNTKYYCNSLE